jgi:large subunit ribosomal protein L11
VTIYSDRSFTFILKTPPTSELLKKAAGIEKGSGTAGRAAAIQIPADKIRQIAEIKLKDLNANNLDQAIKVVLGTARSMGLEAAE